MTLFGIRAFEDVIKLRILRCDHPRLFRWTLNPRTSILTRERREEMRRDHVKMEGKRSESEAI